MKETLEELLEKREDIKYHMAWGCRYDSFEYDCYKEDLDEVEREIEALNEVQE